MRSKYSEEGPQPHGKSYELPLKLTWPEDALPATAIDLLLLELSLIARATSASAGTANAIPDYPLPLLEPLDVTGEGDRDAADAAEEAAALAAVQAAEMTALVQAQVQQALAQERQRAAMPSASPHETGTVPFVFGLTPTEPSPPPTASPLGYPHGTGGPNQPHVHDGGGVISADVLMAVLSQDTARDVSLGDIARRIYRATLQHPSILARESAALLLSCKYDNGNRNKAFLLLLDRAGEGSELLGRAPHAMKSQPTFTAMVLRWIAQDANRFTEHTQAFLALLQRIQLFEGIQDCPWSHQVHLLLSLHLYCLGTPLQAATGGWPVGTLPPFSPHSLNKPHLDRAQVTCTGHRRDSLTVRVKTLFAQRERKLAFSVRGVTGGLVIVACSASSRQGKVGPRLAAQKEAQYI